MHEYVDGCCVSMVVSSSLFLVHQAEVEKLKLSLASVASETERDKSSLHKVTVENDRLRKEVKKVI